MEEAAQARQGGKTVRGSAHEPQMGGREQAVGSASGRTTVRRKRQMVINFVFSSFCFLDLLVHMQLERTNLRWGIIDARQSLKQSESDDVFDKIA